MEALHVDVAVVGASVAGCAAATLFASEGLRVALVEKASQEESYKRLCTHFLQPCAVPVLERLGVKNELESAGAVRNHLEIWTDWGWIKSPDDGPHGYNVRRETLDPLMRRMALRTPGVVYVGGHAVDTVDVNGTVGRLEAVSLRGERTQVRAQLVVAADGRDSTVAKLVGVHAKQRRNERFTYFTYFKGLRLSKTFNSRYWHMGDRLAYAFENDGDVTLLGSFLPLHELHQFKQNIDNSFHEFWAQVPEGPNLRSVERVGEYRGMLNQPNRWRPRALNNLAFVGDAAVSVDPIWGTGCAWALQSAEWLVDATTPALRAGNRRSIERGLNVYKRKHLMQIGPHAAHIADFSTLRPDRSFERLLYSAAAKDAQLAAALHRYLARLESPLWLVRPKNLYRAALVNLASVLRRDAPTKHLPLLTKEQDR